MILPTPVINMQVKNVCRLLALLLCAVLLVAIAACAPEDAGDKPGSSTSSTGTSDRPSGSTTTTGSNEQNPANGGTTTTTGHRENPEDGLDFGAIDGVTTTTTTTVAREESPADQTDNTTTTTVQQDVSENKPTTTTTTEADWFGKDEGYLPPVGF